MALEQYYPCLMNDDTGELSRRVGPAMSHGDAVLYLKQNHPGAWQQARATPQPASHAFFASQAPRQDNDNAQDN
jgi:hypothetical protein